MELEADRRMSSLNVYHRRRKIDVSDNQWLLSTPAKSTPSSYVCDKSLIILTPPGGDDEIATTSATTINTMTPLSQSGDVDDKFAGLLSSFNIPTPEKSIPLGLNFHNSIDLLPQCCDLNNKFVDSHISESSGMADPIYAQDSATIGIEAVPLPQGCDLNEKLTKSSPIFGISTPASKDKKRKINRKNHLETPKKKVYWPKVIGQTKRKTKSKITRESKTKRKRVSMVNGDKGKYKRTPKSKSAKKSKESTSKEDEGKCDVFCYETSLNVDKYEVHDEFLSTLKEHVISEKTPLYPKTKSSKRSLIFELEENFEQPLHVQNELDELGFKGDSLQILRKKIPQKRTDLGCPLLVRIRRMKVNIPIRKRSEIQRKKMIQKRELPFYCNKKRKRSGNRRRRLNLFDVLICNPTSLSKQGVEGEKEEIQGLVDKFKWKTKRKRTTKKKRIEKVEPINSTIDIIPKQEIEKWEIREGSKALCSMSNFVQYPLDEDSMGEDEAKDEMKGKIRRKITKTKEKKISSKEMKFLIMKFRSLDINKEKKVPPYKNQGKKLLPYKGMKEGSLSELVPYNNQDGGLVSYKGMKEGQRTKVKVDLDSKSLKEWNLLMAGKSPNENEENGEYWRKERSIYFGRVEAFIARMHEFLGDRSFLRWKGSVLDSVIGVFLTQNVSDHLSSSAYMSLASDFAIKERKDNVPLLKHEDSSIASATNNSLNLGNKKLYSPGIVFGKKKLVSTKKKVDQSEEERRKKEEQEAEEQDKQYWESLRRMYIHNCTPRSSDHDDSIDWEAVRCADVNKVAKAIEGRGQHNMIAQRIQALLNKLVEMHGNVDLEWLRYAPPNLVKEYLLKVYGLGLKSVECIRLLALEQMAFPVDVNVGRIAVRLGWVPLEPLPGSIQFHLLDQYPIMDVVQQYLWPRLCTLDQPTLYMLHYHLITFGKVLCTKKQPNCKACPMRGECKHFASASASPTFALPANNADGKPKDSSVRSNVAVKYVEGFSDQLMVCNVNDTSTSNTKQCEPIVDCPTSPSLENTQIEIDDIEDWCKSDNEYEELMTINLNKERLRAAKNYFESNDMEDSNEVVAFNPNTASKFMPKMKIASRLRTERMVYVLPDMHPLLAEFPMREIDDPSNYLLVMWTPEEFKESSCETTQNQCSCSNNNCFSCNNIKEENNQTVPGTILVPCRTARNGRFPLNGTYFQVNEVFADANSIEHPIDVPTKWLWNLPIRITYFGTSTSAIFRDLSLEEIQECFWRGYVCVRATDRKTGAPKPLPYRFHYKTANQQAMKKKRQRNNQDWKGNQSGNA